MKEHQDGKDVNNGKVEKASTKEKGDKSTEQKGKSGDEGKAGAVMKDINDESRNKT